MGKKWKEKGKGKEKEKEAPPKASLVMPRSRAMSAPAFTTTTAATTAATTIAATTTTNTKSTTHSVLLSWFVFSCLVLPCVTF